MDVALRAVTAADEGFLLEVYGSTRAEEMALAGWEPEQVEAFVRMQFEAQRRGYAEAFPGAEHSVVLADGAPAGRLWVDRSDEIRVLDIALLPRHRGAGAGTRLMRDLMAEAARTGRPLRLHAESWGRPAGWYRRLGFRVIDHGLPYIEMEWRPGFAGFRDLVLAEPALQAELLAEAHVDAFVERVVDLGRRCGYSFGPEAVAAALRSARQSRIERWIE